MERCENAELRAKMLQHLAEKYKLTEIREPNHLSTYVYCLTKGYFGQKQPAEPSEEEIMLFSLGYGLQDVLTPKDATAPRVEANGIIYRPDMVFDGFGAKTTQNGLCELKTTRKSAKMHYSDESLAETWIAYMKGGCSMMDTDEYNLIVLYMMGSYCLDPETPILTAKLTWVPLGALKVGDLIVGVDEYAEGKWVRRKLKYTPVKSLTTKILDSTRIHLSNGTSVVSSNKHLWLVQRDRPNAHSAPVWVATQSLVEDDRIRQLCDVWSCSDSYDEGWLGGFIDGEGSLETYHGLRVQISQNDNIALLQAKRILDEELSIDMSEQVIGKNLRSLRTKDMANSIKLLGLTRPVRLLEKLNIEGVALPQHNSSVSVIGLEPVGDYEVVAIETGSRTLIANGLVSHNSPPFPKLYADRIRFTQQELEENWFRLLDRKALFDKVIVEGKPPKPFTTNYEWECRYCGYNLMCQSLANYL